MNAISGLPLPGILGSRLEMQTNRQNLQFFLCISSTHGLYAQSHLRIISIADHYSFNDEYFPPTWKMSPESWQNHSNKVLALQDWAWELKT